MKTTDLHACLFFTLVYLGMAPFPDDAVLPDPNAPVYEQHDIRHMIAAQKLAASRTSFIDRQYSDMDILHQKDHQIKTRSVLADDHACFHDFGDLIGFNEYTLAKGEALEERYHENEEIVYLVYGGVLWHFPKPEWASKEEEEWHIQMHQQGPVQENKDVIESTHIKVVGTGSNYTYYDKAAEDEEYVHFVQIRFHEHGGDAAEDHLTIQHDCPDYNEWCHILSERTNREKRKTSIGHLRSSNQIYRTTLAPGGELKLTLLSGETAYVHVVHTEERYHDDHHHVQVELSIHHPYGWVDSTNIVKDHIEYKYLTGGSGAFYFPVNHTKEETELKFRSFGQKAAHIIVVTLAPQTSEEIDEMRYRMMCVDHGMQRYHDDQIIAILPEHKTPDVVTKTLPKKVMDTLQFKSDPSGPRWEAPNGRTYKQTQWEVSRTRRKHIFRSEHPRPDGSIYVAGHFSRGEPYPDGYGMPEEERQARERSHPFRDPYHEPGTGRHEAHLAMKYDATNSRGVEHPEVGVDPDPVVDGLPARLALVDKDPYEDDYQPEARDEL